ncbi:MAG: hypothetical protein AAGJ86_06760 [Pseudomonadota bacterium]
MTRRPTLLLPLLVLLTGCVHQPQTYQAADELGAQGYSSAQTAPNRFVVSFTGNGSASDDELETLALRRAAELTIMHGGTWFDIVDRESIDEVMQARPMALGVRQIDPMYLRTGISPIRLGVTAPIIAGANLTTRLPPKDGSNDYLRVAAREYTIQIETFGEHGVQSPTSHNAFALLEQITALTP